MVGFLTTQYQYELLSNGMLFMPSFRKNGNINIFTLIVRLDSSEWVFEGR